MTLSEVNGKFTKRINKTVITNTDMGDSFDLLMPDVFTVFLNKDDDDDDDDEFNVRI